MSPVASVFRSVAAAACLRSVGAADWPEFKNDLGTSGELAEGVAVPYKEAKITWQANMAGHSHYDLKNAALFMIDPQAVYGKCPEKLAVEDLVKPPTEKDFDGHSPLCCEKFDSTIAHVNQIAKAFRKKEMPVFVHAHVYRDLDDDKKVDNCGRICDFDVLGWTKWPMAWNLWNADFPWSKVVYKTDETPNGFEADFDKDYYAEKSTYSAMTKPVVKKLKELGVDTVVITGFMAQFCSVTTARHAHDLGFKVVYVTDGNDGPKLLELLSTIDENKFIPFTLGVAVADTTDTAGILKALGEEIVVDASRLWDADMPAPVEEKEAQGFSGAALVGACSATAVVFFVAGMAVRRLGSAGSSRSNQLLQGEVNAEE